MSMNTKNLEYQVQAEYLAKGIDLIKTALKLDKNLVGQRREFLTYILGKYEYFFVFSFGAITFVNVDSETQTSIKRSLSKFLINPVKKKYEESYLLREKEGTFNVGGNAAELPKVTLEEIEIASRILAQSVALDYIEDLTDEALTNIEIMNAKLEKSGRFIQNVRPVLKLVAQNNNIIQFIISKLSLLDKPDIVWEKEQLETFFSQLADFFELRSRFRNIEYKIGFARDNSEFALNVIEAQRGNFLELIIIILLFFDIILYFFGS